MQDASISDELRAVLGRQIDMLQAQLDRLETERQAALLAELTEGNFPPRSVVDIDPLIRAGQRRLQLFKAEKDRLFFATRRGYCEKVVPLMLKRKRTER